ncbi:MAG: hypothetical protein V1814_00095 [Candidatus Moraniibacteriota bacterium]
MRFRLLVISLVLFFQCSPVFSVEQPGCYITPELTGYVAEVGLHHLVIVNQRGILALPGISNLGHYRLLMAYTMSHDQQVRFFAKITCEQLGFHIEVMNPRLVPKLFLKE